tara:strand:- start:670 stop:1428 length:759 start_codon:yes stop_codon:yes gene_type:complete
MIKKVTIIGSGNIATQLGMALHKNKFDIIQIISRNKQTGKNLAKKTKSQFTDKLNEIKKTELIIICVNDDEIINIIKKLPNTPMVHTSGSTHINIFKHQNDCGVFYPLQSLNKDINVDFQNVPICIESNNNNLEKKLNYIANKISQQVVMLNSKQRKYLHLSAVIASNFSNYCYLIAQSILKEEKIDFNLLLPLIQHTANKTLKANPKKNQTGPAMRGDTNIIKEHLAILKNPNHKKIYKLLSDNIINEYAK